MINEQIETLFVNTYIKKEYRERLIFELKDTSSKTHRRTRIVYKDRFAIIKEETEIGAPFKYILVNK